MRWFRISALVAAMAGPAYGHDIVDVLRYSQQMRLDGFAAAPAGPRAERVRRSFETLRRTMPDDVAVDLLVITGPTVAETLHGHVVVANEALAELPEGERLFVLAHELGHVVGGHWLQMGRVYRRWVPGEVTQEQTDAVAAQLGREASSLAHRQEFEADAYAVQLLRRVGRTPEDAVSAFMHLGPTQDTATHPGTRKRLASLRAAQPPGTDGSGGDDPE